MILWVLSHAILLFLSFSCYSFGLLTFISAVTYRLMCDHMRERCTGWSQCAQLTVDFTSSHPFSLMKISKKVVVVVVVVDFIYSRWSNRQSLLKGTYWRKKKRRKGQKIEIWEGRINWLNHYGMNYNTELENYIQLLMSPTVNEMNLG